MVTGVVVVQWCRRDNGEYNHATKQNRIRSRRNDEGTQLSMIDTMMGAHEVPLCCTLMYIDVEKNKSSLTFSMSEVRSKEEGSRDTHGRCYHQKARNTGKRGKARTICNNFRRQWQPFGDDGSPFMDSEHEVRRKNRRTRTTFSPLPPSMGGERSPLPTGTKHTGGHMGSQVCRQASKVNKTIVNIIWNLEIHGFRDSWLQRFGGSGIQGFTDSVIQ